MTREVYLVIGPANVGHLSHEPLPVGEDTVNVYHYTFKSDEAGARGMESALKLTSGGARMALLNEWVEYEYATVKRIK